MKALMVLTMLALPLTPAHACPGGKSVCIGAEATDAKTCQEKGGSWATPRGLGCGGQKAQAAEAADEQADAKLVNVVDDQAN